ncbi:MAG: DUF1569 domain-containing protein [Planctomycetaceae bacterium]|nr:DUF1569 domain-containing protein [Planctomycetaceae bacterium]
MSEIKTNRVTGRRAVHYDTLDELLAEAERLASEEIEMLGNWTYPQILKHLALSMNNSIDGFPGKAPLPIRLVVRLLRESFLSKSLPAGFKFPNRFRPQLEPPEETTLEEGLEDLRQAIARVQSDSQRAPHPVLGQLSREDYDRLHLRHAEMHMSFVRPVRSPETVAESVSK